MNKVQIAKCVTNFVVGTGVSTIVKGIVKNNVSVVKPQEQAAVYVGMFVLSSMAVDAVSTYTDSKIDEAIDWWNQNIKSKD